MEAPPLGQVGMPSQGGHGDHHVADDEGDPQGSDSSPHPPLQVVLGHQDEITGPVQGELDEHGQPELRALGIDQVEVTERGRLPWHWVLEMPSLLVLAPGITMYPRSQTSFPTGRGSYSTAVIFTW